MRRIALAFTLVAGLVAPAHADFTSKNQAGSTITFKSSGDCTSIVCVVPHYLTDSTGTAVGTTGAPLFFSFGTGVTLPAYASTPTFNLGTLNGAATATNQATVITDLGAVTETAPASDTASSGLNGRLQRLAQSITILNGKIDTLNATVAGPMPLAVNGAAQGVTGLTPGVPQTGTIYGFNVDNTSWAGVALGAMANYGTSPGAVKVPGVNAFITNPVSLAPNGLTAGSFVSGTTAAMTGTTSTQVVAAVSSQRLYITRVKCNNTSSTATLVQIRDGSAGTVLDTLAAGATYGGEQGTGPTPLFWTTAGNALFAQDVTTGASVICTASGYSGT